MRICTVHTTLFRTLRDVRERRVKTRKKSRSLPRYQRRLRVCGRAIDSFLVSYYRVCGHTGLPTRASSPTAPEAAAPLLPAGVLDGLIGIVIFSLTMPVMKIAVREFDPVFVGVGRMLVAAIPAGLTLLVLKVPLPSARQFLSLLIIMATLVFGFSWLLAESLCHVASHHAAVVAGSIPLVIAIVAALRERERLPGSFWLTAVAGGLIVIGYGMAGSSWILSYSDLCLMVAAIMGGIGYAEGGRLGKEMGALAVSCWVPVVAVPFALVVCAWRLPDHPWEISPSAWLALGYNGVFSCWLGFIFWYRGLGAGGVARIGQLQLLQPFFTLILVALFFREVMSLGDWIAAGAVICCVAASQTCAKAMATSKSTP